MFDIGDFWLNDKNTVIKANTSRALPGSNLIIFGMENYSTEYYFWPDGLRITTSKESLAIPYQSMIGLLSSTTFIKEYPPNDGVIEFRTWLHTRVDGGRDMRYSYNPYVYAVRYWYVLLKVQDSDKYYFVGSNKEKIRAFYNSLKNYIQATNKINRLYDWEEYQDTNNNEEKNKREYTKKEKTEREQSRKDDDADNGNDNHNDVTGITDMQQAYEILEISPGTDMEKINVAYRQLIAKNHPDKVGHLDAKIQELALNRTKLINMAYQFIKEKFPK